MTIPIQNLLARRIWPFANSADAPQRTYSMGHKSAGEKTVARFGSLNSEIGRYSEHCLDLSAIIGVVADYIKSFFTNSESLLLNGISKLVSATSDGLSAQRDNLMYGGIFTDGIDADVYSSVQHEKNALDTNEVPKLQTKLKGHVDDLAENLGQKQAYGESVVPFFGWLAALSAKIKPIVSPLAAFLPANFKSAIDSALDLGARSWWRMRMFGTSLHANFLTSMMNLAKNGILSIGSASAREDLRNQVTGLGEFARKYFQGEGNTELADSTTHSSMGLYTRMLTDRVASHWKNVWRPKGELVKSLQDKGVLKPGDPTDEFDLKLIAISELTAPFCSAIGLVGTFVFEPLRIIGQFMGLERGMNLITAASTFRKASHLANYITRFIMPEMQAGKDTIAELEDVIKNNTATEMQKQMYLSAKARKNNGMFGMLVASGNIMEPVMHFLGLGQSENNLTKFAFNLFTRFNDTGLLRFFSARRANLGTQATLRAIELHENKSMDKINYTKEEIEAYSRRAYEVNKVDEKFDSVSLLDPLVNHMEKTKASLQPEEKIEPAFTHYAAAV